MKKVAKSIILLIIIFGCVGGYFLFQKIKEDKRLAEIKKGWYVEVISDDDINVRTVNNTSGKTLGVVKKGEIYKVLEVDYESSSAFYWYKIEYNDNVGYIASSKKTPWVNDVNNPTDIAVPVVKFKDNVYHVASINDINYKHLEVIEDTKIYKITHVVYHEVKPSEFIDQYWILYTITDGAGKSSSKMQKIEFDVKPDESQVLDFSLYK